MELSNDFITFGKHKGSYLKDVLKDRNYCRWLVDQPWFLNYDYLYNSVSNYDPLKFFIKPYQGESLDFMDTYEYFNLVPVDKVEIELTDNEKKCYEFYVKTIDGLKDKIVNNKMKNQYDIKAPQKWLQVFEKETGLSREDFKMFINSYDLKNVTTLVEEIKKQGGIEYKGAKSFLIAKDNSVKQENFWEDMLKEKYDDKVSTQFKYNNCFFDFINISDNTIYECKLSLKDFNTEQYDKYILTLNKYKIIYLIGRDAIINLENKVILTLNFEKYMLYLAKIPIMSKPSYFDTMIEKFELKEITCLVDSL
jgi:hypothetical protein